MPIKVNIFTWRISSLRCSICSEIYSGFSIITSLNPLFITGKKQRCSLETLFSQATWSFFWNFAKSVRISSTMIGVHAPAYFCQFTPKIESPYIRNWSKRRYQTENLWWVREGTHCETIFCRLKIVCQERKNFYENICFSLKTNLPLETKVLLGVFPNLA